MEVDIPAPVTIVSFVSDVNRAYTGRRLCIPKFRLGHCLILRSIIQPQDSDCKACLRSTVVETKQKQTSGSVMPRSVCARCPRRIQRRNAQPPWDVAEAARLNLSTRLKIESLNLMHIIPFFFLPFALPIISGDRSCTASFDYKHFRFLVGTD